MKPKILVIDDVFNSEDLNLIQDNIRNNDYIQYGWYDIMKDHKFSFLCNSLLNLSSQFYNLTNTIGYEFWFNINTRPDDWHYDTDQQLYKEKQIYKFPTCSIVYYPLIENLIGGELLIEENKFVPKQNQAIIFKGNLHHRVNKFEGNRYSVVLNPWNILLGIVPV